MKQTYFMRECMAGNDVLKKHTALLFKKKSIFCLSISIKLSFYLHVDQKKHIYF